jgi:hypothetical protein
MHIRYKINLSNKSNNITYTIVNTNNWTLPLNQHPSIVDHPELFEITEDEIPENAEKLNYENNESA